MAAAGILTVNFPPVFAPKAWDTPGTPAFLAHWQAAAPAGASSEQPPQTAFGESEKISSPICPPRRLVQLLTRPGGKNRRPAMVIPSKSVY